MRRSTPFFVSRQVICGAVRVGGGGSGFQISQRADFFEFEVRRQTTSVSPGGAGS